MKIILKIVLCLTLGVPVLAFSNDKLQCAGINFDISKNQDPRSGTVLLTKEDQQFHIVFSGNLNGNEFRVVLDKSSNEIHGYIHRANGEIMQSHAKFNNDRFEFGVHQGIMIPVTATALVCKIEE